MRLDIETGQAGRDVESPPRRPEAGRVALCQALAAGIGLVVSIWVEAPWIGVAALGVLSLAALGATLTRAGRGQGLRGGWLITAWTCSALAPASFFFAPRPAFTLDVLHAAVAWLMGAMVGACGATRETCVARTQTQILALCWGWLGCGLWLASSYEQNVPSLFYFGILAAVGMVLLGKFWFRPSRLGAQAANTLIVVLIGLPLADSFVRPSRKFEVKELAGRPYSFESARGNPDAFGRWWSYYLGQWESLARDLFIPDPAKVLPFRLRPGGHGRLGESDIHVNRLGFRGPEVAEDKGPAYRIVALGESTTFGCTLRAGDEPWPEILERLIRERIRVDRPIEVINAGVPAYQLPHNVARLPTDILPLHPDLVISYHGVNGFRLLNGALPSLTGRAPPAYQPRPLTLLADCEYRWRVIRYARRQRSLLPLRQAAVRDLMTSPYAQAYEELIQITQTNGIRLALANFSMAVNAESDPAIVEFYGATFPVVTWLIRANQAHTQLVQALAAEHPQVCLVDTHPQLDGVHQKFIDLAHLTQEGRQQLAETMFRGIRPVLEADLTPRDSSRAPGAKPGP